MSSVDFVRERRRFPLLDERVYCASQCMGLFPESMLEDLDAYRRSLLLRNRVIDEWVDRLGEMRQLFERLLSAPRGSVMVRDSATAAQAAVAACLSPTGKRTRIIVSSSDFHSSRYMWSAQARRGFDVVEVSAADDAHADGDTFVAHIDERTAVVALSLVSPRSGALLDVAKIARAAASAGAIVVIDAYQAVGIVHIDVRALGAHMVVGGTHKWLGGGGMGLAFAYVDPGLSERLTPVYPGWIGHFDMLGFGDKFIPARGAERFQQGTPSLEPIYTARAGVNWVLDVGVESLREQSLALTQRIIEIALARGLSVRTPSEGERRGGMVCIDVPDAKEIANRLGASAVDVDARPGAGVRIGPHPCVTMEECERVVRMVAEGA